MKERSALAGLIPHAVWRHFEGLSRVPRGSGQEERAVAFVRDFGLALALETRVDPTDNVVIRKPATRGMEDRPTVALQCHLDMVQQQDEGRGFDFANDPIELVVGGDWLRADGTTLGADNGIGVALIMAVLASNDMEHPPIEALFTVDEEVGMSGAEAVTSDQLSAHYLINLDSESDREFTIGSAGAVDIVAEAEFESYLLPADCHLYEIEVRGGLGGHSGLDIHLGRMNAIKTLAQALTTLNDAAPVTLVSFGGYGVANAIPRRAKALFAVASADGVAIRRAIRDLTMLVAPFVREEPCARITCARVTETAERGFDAGFQTAFLTALNAVESGVVSMSAEVEGLVETSNNLSIVVAEKGRMSVTCLARTCVDAHKPGVIRQVRESFADTGARVRTENDAPGWVPRTDGPLLKVLSRAYVDLHGERPGVVAVHAGLETGILSNTFPQAEMVSYGPNILGPHSTDERVQISSVQKVWAILKKTLSTIPATGNRGSSHDSGQRVEKRALRGGTKTASRLAWPPVP